MFRTDIEVRSSAISPPPLSVPASGSHEPLPLDDQKAKERHFLKCNSFSFSQSRHTRAF